MELNTISLGDFVKLADVIFRKNLDSVTNYARASGLFQVMNIPENAGDTRQFSEIDDNEYLSLKDEGDQAKRGKVQQGYTKTLQPYRVAENIGITYEMRSRNKYPEVVNRITNAAKKGPNRMDLDLSHRFTFGTSTSYTDMDGVSRDTSTGDTKSLFNTAHTLKGSSTTYRNRLAGNPQLSRGALESMEKLAVEETYNQFGEKMTLSYDVLWTTDDPATVNTAREYLNSVANPDASHEGVTNVYQQKYRHVVLPRVATDANGGVDTSKRRYWGIASSMISSAYLGVWEEPHMMSPSGDKQTEDLQTDDWTFRVRAGYGITIVDGKWIRMSSGDDTA